jgi:hypothetical protein
VVGLVAQSPADYQTTVELNDVERDIIAREYQVGPVAQNPADYQAVVDLDGGERDIITREYEHRWSHPLSLYITIALCSVGAATQRVLLLPTRVPI